MSKEVKFLQGNEACAEGAIAAGVTFFGGYPITPSTEIAEAMAAKAPASSGAVIMAGAAPNASKIFAVNPVTTSLVMT